MAFRACVARAAVRPAVPAAVRLPHLRSFNRSLSATSTLVLADHDNKKLGNDTLKAVSAASKLGAPVTILVAGNKCAAVAAEASKVAGVAKVVIAEDAAYEHGIAENITTLIESLQKANKYSHIVGSTTAVSRATLPRVAVKLDVQPVSDVISIQSADTFVRPVYAGNALSTVQSKDGVKVLTVRSTAFEAATTGGNAVEVSPFKVEGNADAGLSSWVSEEITKSERPELTSARVVIAGGRGLASQANFGILDKLADRVGGAVGASRAAVDAGYAPNDQQVGQTGKVVAPELYIAVGISGAIQHLAGMKDSKVIVAINKDAEAPIFQVADYGIVGDLFKVVPELDALLAKK